MSSNLATIDSNVGLAVAGGNVNISGNVLVNCSTQESLQLEGFNIPRLITTFKGREKQIETLDSLFFKQKKRKVVVCGLPGYGKSELSKQYATKCVHNNKIDKAFWIEAENQDNLRKSFENLTKIYNKYKGNTKLLFVFDNATSRQEIFNYEPPDEESFFLLITSIEKEWDNDVEPLKLDPLSSAAVLDVYQSILSDNYQDEDSNLYKELADVVGNVPLGLQITGAYVRQQNKRLGKEFNLKSYVETLKQSQTKIITLPMPRSTANTYRKSIYEAIKISLDKINNEEDTELGRLALEILYVSCYLDPEWIYSRDILRVFNSCTEMLVRNNINIDEFMNALGLLENFCFINYVINQGILGMHRFIQDILRFHVRKYDSQMQSKFYGMCLLHYVLCNTRCNSIGDSFKYVLSHADENVITVHEYFEKEKKYLFINKYANRNLIINLVENGCIKCLKKILNESGKLATKYINRYNLLHKAVRNNHLEIVKLLLEYDCDIENKTVLGDTPLHEAANIWSMEAIRILIANKADLNARNYNGDIPLFSLFRDIGSEEINNHFIDRKAPQYIVFSDDMKKRFIINTYIEENGWLSQNKTVNLEAINDILDMLKLNDNKMTMNNYGETILHIVVSTCNLHILKLLINKYNMDVNIQYGKGRTPLYSLICRPHAELNIYFDIEKAVATARLLIMHGAKLDIKNPNGLTLIEIAEMKDVLYIVATHSLIKKKVFMISLCDNRCIKELKQVFNYLGGRTKDYIIKMKFIQQAIYSNQLDILKLLLQYVDINQMNSPPLLHTAAFFWSSDSIKMLLQHHNADLNTTDSTGGTALFHFVHGARARNSIDLEKAIEILDLLKIEDHKNITNKSGATLLHLSAALCQEELMTLLVKKYKMKTDIKDKFGETPLNVLISYLGTREVKKECVINIVKVLQDCDDHLNDDAIFTILKSLIVESDRDLETILPYIDPPRNKIIKNNYCYNCGIFKIHNTLHICYP